MTDDQGATHSLGAELKGVIVTQAAVDQWTYLDSARFDGDAVLEDSMGSVDGTPCYIIRMRPRGGIAALLYVDQKTSLPRQVVMTTDMGTVYSRADDYRAVDGIMIPYRSVESSEAGLVTGTSTIVSVEFNVPLSDTLFEPVAPAAESDYLGKNVDSVIVPFELWRNHIYVKVTIDGKGPFDFIFDTGAGGVGINRRLLQQLSLKLLGATEARGIGGTDASEAYRIDSLRVGEILLSDLSAYAVDFSPIESTGWRKIDGVVGYDLLSRFVVTVDYAGHNLVFYRNEISPRENWGSKCPLTIDFRLPYIDAMINDSINGRFRLDTGSHSSLDLNSPFVRDHQLVDTDSGKYHQITAFGVGGSTTGLIGMLPSLVLCGTRLDSILANFSTSGSGIFAGANTAGNIGSGILKGFAVTLDYGRESVYFRESPGMELLRHTRNMAGIEIARTASGISVVSVLAGKPAEGVLKPSDLILAIDGIDLKQKSIDEINHLLIGDRGSDVVLRIKRGNGTLLVKIAYDSLY